MKRLKKTQIAEYKKQLLIKQGYLCGICCMDMTDLPTRDLCLDHDHKAGHVRSVLCRNCNGIEGKIFNLCNRGKRSWTVRQFIERVSMYWDEHSQKHDADTVYHPDHKTTDEKRLDRNKKARLARVRKAAVKNIKGK